MSHISQCSKIFLILMLLIWNLQLTWVKQLILRDERFCLTILVKRSSKMEKRSKENSFLRVGYSLIRKCWMRCLKVCYGKEKSGQLDSNTSMYRITEFLWVVGCKEAEKKVGSGQELNFTLCSLFLIQKTYPRKHLSNPLIP